MLVRYKVNKLAKTTAPTAPLLEDTCGKTRRVLVGGASMCGLSGLES